ncbi:uncharacterized protein B0T23DRAFT_80037 [Neurospora hispaniola]|uniref:Uncharacterized protein n=1 Tax=Neurospora hispaniola TaxID=588809 RepID=A0AAJ0ICT6_9PEZI|nr:hypothetical protein B0T23DRAFT_80037 [Neurospora hispaniola]
MLYLSSFQRLQFQRPCLTVRLVCRMARMESNAQPRFSTYSPRFHILTAPLRLSLFGRVPLQRWFLSKQLLFFDSVARQGRRHRRRPTKDKKMDASVIITMLSPRNQQQPLGRSAPNIYY